MVLGGGKYFHNFLSGGSGSLCLRGHQSTDCSLGEVSIWHHSAGET